MTALTPDDPRGKENPNSLSPVDAEDYAAIRGSGYANMAVEQARLYCPPATGSCSGHRLC